MGLQDGDIDVLSIDVAQRIWSDDQIVLILCYCTVQYLRIDTQKNIYQNVGVGLTYRVYTVITYKNGIIFQRKTKQLLQVFSKTTDQVRIPCEAYALSMVTSANPSFYVMLYVLCNCVH